MNIYNLNKIISLNKLNIYKLIISDLEICFLWNFCAKLYLLCIFTDLFLFAANCASKM
jgi:hypothetical protein